MIDCMCQSPYNIATNVLWEKGGNVHEMDFDEEMNQSPEHVAVVANVALRQEIDVVAASDLLYNNNILLLLDD